MYQTFFIITFKRICETIKILYSDHSPGILGFEMEKNNIKLKILGSAHYVLLYYLQKVPKFPLSGTSFF